MKITEYAAHTFSIILHPVLMTIYGFCILFAYAGSLFLHTSILTQIILPIVILSCIFPLNGFFLLKRFGLINDYRLTDRKDRFLPFLLLFLCHTLLLYYFAQPTTPFWFLGVLSIPLILLIIGGIISYFWKISAHMIGIGALTGCVLTISFYVKSTNPYILSIILFILAGCLGTSRLLLRRHTPAQIYIGFILGFFISILCIWFSIYFITFRF